jgi:ubiquitin carboxyl-terminal hydrolase 7
MVIREDDTLSSIKERIQKKLKVPDEDFSKVMPVYCVTRA